RNQVISTFKANLEPAEFSAGSLVFGFRHAGMAPVLDGFDPLLLFYQQPAPLSLRTTVLMKYGIITQNSYFELQSCNRGEP
ncbi:MAG: hypothetical protein IKZ22_03115, partial [Kiritimatiellae bacterium]|nr:hypothetical protein [Kiritimatiellia bacterium]